ncbi:thaumatin family protein [Streptacidiphilus sp. P02-A3a]|uniref:thaumatin family protein n=1 Tax=Streptacidiphilus sp. P02-A3a TaxID=2704468 RepID=UPI0015FAA33F|nr:thaumatin family protein [Streptacidiphilus sp. P02-A3a]QMU69890.1 thaumatin family protein [Streptacidiphilus sp. P02-A3a]
MGRRRIRSRRVRRRAAVAAAVLLTAALAAALTVVGHSATSRAPLSAAPAATAAAGAGAAASPDAGATPSARVGASRTATRPPASAHPAASTGTASPRKGSTSGGSTGSGSTGSGSTTTAAGGAAPAATAGHRLVTFVNAVQQTIWVAAGQQTAQPALTTTGWVLNPGQSVTISVPDHWNGRFWGRTGCSFDATGHGHCRTGDCGGLFQCTGYGSIPATLAEFNLNSFDDLDFYDVSLVDGSNLPMWINTVGGTAKDPISANGCEAAGCTTPVACPAALQIHAGGAVVGCESPCGVFGTDQYCCRGQWAPRADCDPTKWPVDYAAVFKRAEPFAYSYCDDDATSTFTSTGEAGYRITWGLTP